MKNPPSFFSSDRFTLSGCELRRMRVRDLPSIAAKLAKMDPWKKMNYSPAALARFLGQKDPSLHCLMITVAGKTAGVFCVQYPWMRGSYIALFAVFEPYSGKGIGAELVEWLGGQTAEKCRNLWALVSSFNRRARKFYKQRGFREIAVLEDLVAPGFDEILIRKIVGVRS